MMDFLYRSVLKPVLFAFSPDTVHALFISAGEIAGRSALTRGLFSLFYRYRGEDLSKTVDGIRYRTPLILAAGFDADGQLTEILPSLSFGGEEIGSITALPCEGNPLPRLTRLVRNKSIVVYKGLRNRGVDALIEKLRRTPRIPDFVIGVSIARTNSRDAASDSDAGIRDYVESFRKLNAAGVGDYYTINISCPNAFTGETFTNPALLAQLLPRLKEVPCTKPVYLKMPISVPWEQFAEILALADTHGIHGVIIGNLNKDYQSLQFPEDAPAKFRGGLSGAPTFALSNELIRKTRQMYGKRFTIIGCGGVFTPEDALAKLEAGADLIQLISGMIFEGPGLMRAICERLVLK